MVIAILSKKTAKKFFRQFSWNFWGD